MGGLPTGCGCRVIEGLFGLGAISECVQRGLAIASWLSHWLEVLFCQRIELLVCDDVWFKLSLYKHIFFNLVENGSFPNTISGLSLWGNGTDVRNYRCPPSAFVSLVTDMCSTLGAGLPDRDGVMATGAGVGDRQSGRSRIDGKWSVKKCNFRQPCCLTRLKNAENEKFSQNYISIDRHEYCPFLLTTCCNENNWFLKNVIGPKFDLTWEICRYLRTWLRTNVFVRSAVATKQSKYKMIRKLS